MSDPTSPHLRSVPDPAPAGALRTDLESAGSERRSRASPTPPARGAARRFVTDVLVELGFVTPERVEAAVSEGRTAGKPPERMLLEQERDRRPTSSRVRSPSATASTTSTSPSTASTWRRRTCCRSTSARRYQAVPIGYVDPQTLLVAMADPANVLAVDDIQMATGLAVPDRGRRAGRHRGAARSASNRCRAPSPRRIEDDARPRRSEALDRSATCTPAPRTRRWSSSSTASSARRSTRAPPTSTSSPKQGDMRVRFRVDGVLQEAAHVPKRMVSARDLADQDHERPRHRREAHPAGRPRRRHRRRPPRSTCASRPCRPSAARGRRSGSSTTATRMRTLDELGMDGEARDPLRERRSASPTARSWSPARPARASRRPSTPRWRSSTRSRRTSSRSRTRSSTGSTASTRSTSTARPGSTSPPACARSCAPTPT